MEKKYFRDDVNCSFTNKLNVTLYMSPKELKLAADYPSNVSPSSTFFIWKISQSCHVVCWILPCIETILSYGHEQEIFGRCWCFKNSNQWCPSRHPVTCLQWYHCLGISQMCATCFKVIREKRLSPKSGCKKWWLKENLILSQVWCVYIERKCVIVVKIS